MSDNKAEVERELEYIYELAHDVHSFQRPYRLDGLNQIALRIAAETIVELRRKIVAQKRRARKMLRTWAGRNLDPDDCRALCSEIDLALTETSP